MLEAKIGTDAVLLTPREVAALLRVTVTTLARWEMEGHIKCVRTPGKHRRFLRSEVLRMLGDTEDRC